VNNEVAKFNSTNLLASTLKIVCKNIEHSYSNTVVGDKLLYPPCTRLEF